MLKQAAHDPCAACLRVTGVYFALPGNSAKLMPTDADCMTMLHALAKPMCDGTLIGKLKRLSVAP